MENKRILIIIFLILVLVAVFIPDMYYSFSIVETKTVGIDFTISKGRMLGFIIDNDSLHLGEVPIGGVSRRNFILFNNYSYPLITDIQSVGNVSPYVSISENNFILEPNISRTIRITVHPPKSLNPKPGNYSGNVIVILRKPLIIW